MRSLAINRIAPGATPEDRRDFAAVFNATLDQLGIKPGEEFIISTVDGTPPPKHGHCRWCGDPIDPAKAWKRESGYVKPRAMGGTNALAIREEHPDDLACDRCVSRMKRGVAPTQEALV